MTPPENLFDIEHELEFAEARYPIRLSLPSGRAQSLEDAKQAVRAEYRDSVKWKRMRPGAASMSVSSIQKSHLRQAPSTSAHLSSSLCVFYSSPRFGEPQSAKEVRTSDSDANLQSRSLWTSVGKSRSQSPVTSSVPSPPMTTEGTTPKPAAIIPDSNSPS